MGVFRTADAGFAGLAAYPFEPHHLEADGLRVHDVDFGLGPVVLLLHGEPA